MRTLWTLLLGLACQPDEPAPPKASDPPPDTASQAETGSTTDSAASDTSTADTSDTAGMDAPPADTVYAWVDSEPSCLARIRLPDGTPTDLVCAPAGYDGQGRFQVYEDRDHIVAVEGVLTTAVWATYAVDPATAAPGVTHRFAILVVDLEQETSAVVASGISYGTHPDRVEVSGLVPTGPDRGFAIFSWPETGRRTLVELEAGLAVVDRTPGTSDVAVLGGAEACVWARVDGVIGRMCPEGLWEPMPDVSAVGPGSAASVVVEAQPSGDEVLALWDGVSVVSRSAPLTVPAVAPTWLPGGGGVFSHAAFHVWSGVDGEVVSFDWPSETYARLLASPSGSHVAYATGSYDEVSVVRIGDLQRSTCAGSPVAWSMLGHYVVAWSSSPYGPGAGSLRVCDPVRGSVDSVSADVGMRPLSVQW